MNTVETVKTSISGLSASDQSDVLMHILRLKYHALLGNLRQMAPTLDRLELEEEIDALPYDVLLERLQILEGIQAGLLDIKQGNSISHAEIKKRFRTWQEK